MESNHNTRHIQPRASESETINTRSGSEQLREWKKRSKSEGECNDFNNAVIGRVLSHLDYFPNIYLNDKDHIQPRLTKSLKYSTVLKNFFGAPQIIPPK